MGGPEPLEPRLALASAASLVLDINALPLGADPASFAVVGNIAYFAAGDAACGRELWRTDGTAAGTLRVADIEPGSAGSDPEGLTPVGTQLFFAATRAGDRELWVTDGTSSGTRLVKNIKTVDPGAYGAPEFSSAPSQLTAFGGRVWFAADDGTHGTELWVSDGTEAGTVLVRDLDPRGTGTQARPDSGAPLELTPFQGRLFFTGVSSDQDSIGRVLWSTDGTEPGTVVVSQISAGKGGEPGELAVSGGRLFFAASGFPGTREVWTSDGTGPGTTFLATVRAQSLDPLNAIYDIVPFAGGVVFSGDDGSSGHEPWFSDGTTSGTRPLADIAAAGGSDPSRAVVVGSRAYFAATSAPLGRELWSTDGTPAGTKLVQDIHPGAAGSEPVALTALGGVLAFAADDGTHGREPWVSDGTAAGTRLVEDIRPGGSGVGATALPGAVVALAGRLLFAADDGGGTQPWVSDGTVAGTARVATIPIGTADAFDAAGAPAPSVARAVLDGFVFFPADDGIHGRELWKTDGTAAGTSLVADLTPGADGKPIDWMAAVGDRLFFMVGGGYDTSEQPIPAKLFVTRGSAATTVQLAEGPFEKFASAGGRLFARRSGGEIIRTDGTPAGTSILDDAVQADYGWVDGLLGVGDRVFYEKEIEATVAGVAVRRRSIWTAGAVGGPTELVGAEAYGAHSWYWGLPLTSGSGPGDAFLIMRSDDAPATGAVQTIWKVDAQGNLGRFGDLTVGWGFTDRAGAVVDGSAYFTDFAGDLLELRVSDGTPAGSRIVGPLGTRPADASLYVDSMQAFGTGVAFALVTHPYGGAPARSLWLSDGTTAGTREFVAGIESIEGQPDGRLAYRKRGDDGRLRMFLTDGTGAGSTVPDASARIDVDPSLLGAVGGRLVFVAADAAHGREVFAFPISVSAPGAPRGVTAVPSSGQVTVSWTAPASDGNSSLVDYRLERSSDGGLTWQAVADGVSTATTATVTGLVNGSSYLFRVAAVNAVGTGPATATAAAAVPSKPAGAPSLVRAVRGDGQVTLSWKAPLSTGGSPIVDYQVQSSTDGGASWTTVADGVSAALSTTVTGLANGVARSFRVAAVNSVGAGAMSLRTPPVIPAGRASAPADLVAVRGNRSVTLSWTAPVSNGLPITDYVVQASTDGGTTWKTAPDRVSPLPSARIAGLANGTPYAFRVTAITGVGAGFAGAASAPVVPATLAGVPLALVGTRGDGRVTLAWRAPVSSGGLPITDYVVERSGDNGKTWSVVEDAVSATPAATVTGLVNGTPSVFRVAAVNEVGVGPFTPKTAIVVPATTPGAPTGLAVTRSGTKATLTWTAPASSGGVAIVDYPVEWSADGGATWKRLVRKPSALPTATVAGLSATQAYRFRVATRNAAGLQGAFVEVASDVAVA
ncbi:MAG: ELWxxDGT repeat protein [Planctomycetaceae bacterium]